MIFGSASGFGSDVGGRQVIDLTSLTASQGFIIQGDAVSDRAGRSVSSAGDVNGDGYDDLIVGAPFGDAGGSDAGEAYVIFGSATGSTTGINAAGTVGANTMIGTAGDDTLDGAGGADVIRAGAGDDVIIVADAAFRRIDGGGGDDTLRLDGAGINLDFTAIAQNAVTSIERIDLTGSGDNTLTLTRLDVFDMMDAREGGVAILRVTGNAGDTVDFSDTGWTLAGTIVEGAITYNRYTNANAEVRVEQGVSVDTAAAIPGSFGAPEIIAFNAMPAPDNYNFAGLQFEFDRFSSDMAFYGNAQGLRGFGRNGPDGTADLRNMVYEVEGVEVLLENIKAESQVPMSDPIEQSGFDAGYAPDMSDWFAHIAGAPRLIATWVDDGFGGKMKALLEHEAAYDLMASLAIEEAASIVGSLGEPVSDPILIEADVFGPGLASNNSAIIVDGSLGGTISSNMRNDDFIGWAQGPFRRLEDGIDDGEGVYLRTVDSELTALIDSLVAEEGAATAFKVVQKQSLDVPVPGEVHAPEDATQQWSVEPVGADGW